MHLCTSSSSTTQKSMPAKKHAVVVAAAPLGPSDFSISACAFTKISMNETYSITPAEIASATDRITPCFTDAKICGTKATAPPMPVASPAPSETTIAVLTLAEPQVGRPPSSAMARRCRGQEDDEVQRSPSASASLV